MRAAESLSRRNKLTRQLALLPAKFARAHALHERGQLAQAQALYEEILRIQPAHVDALHLSGVIAAQTGHYQKAVDLMGKAAAIKPSFAEAHFNLGNVLRELGRWDAALVSYNQAIAHKADLAEAYLNRGVVLQELKQLDAALESYNQAIALKADDVETYSNRGVVLQELQQLEAALASHNQAIALKADDAEAHNNLGLVQYELQQLDAALASYTRAIMLKTDYAQAYYNRSFAMLLAGDLERGWTDHEWRWKNKSGSSIKEKRNFPQPLWLGGESIAGKAILLHSEQGLGDTLQFCRYASRVADLGARVILQVQRPLKSLLTSLGGVAQVVVQGDALPAFDYYCPMMSLPLAFKTTLSTIPANIPYLKSDAQKVLYWREKLGEKTAKLRVGLVWSGGFFPNQPEVWAVNRRRNVPLAKLAPLNHPAIEFYSLQKGQPAESELAALISRDWDGPRLLDYTSLLNDFSDTAALIEQLDLVISVDTSTAHLAGALGKPVWILNRFDSCWRWLLDRTDSPWYPTIKLYRQERAGDWDSVIHRVSTDLKQLVA